MNKLLRYLLLALIFAGCAGLIVLMVREKPRPALESTLAPFYQLLGNVPKSLSQSVLRVIPVDQMDEAQYGQAIVRKYQQEHVANAVEQAYLDALVAYLGQFKKKAFPYTAFIVNGAQANAFALPGGVIVVTRGLLAAMKSEGELAAVIAHEMGHIERSHCLNQVKYELLAKKIGGAEAGELVDFTTALFLRHTYSKTQENEADEYAFELIRNTAYDPLSVSRSLERLLVYQQGQAMNASAKEADPIRDYFLSHPPLEVRLEKYREKGKQWWRQNPGQQRYIGLKNLEEQTAYTDKKYPQEWVLGAQNQ